MHLTPSEDVRRPREGRANGFVGTDKFYYWATDHNGNFTRASVAVDVYHDAILQ